MFEVQGHGQGAQEENRQRQDPGRCSFRIRGHGLPDVRTGRSGDELVQVAIETPTRLNNRQQELLREFAATENKTVSPKSTSFFEKLKNYFGNHR